MSSRHVREEAAFAAATAHSEYRRALKRLVTAAHDVALAGSDDERARARARYDEELTPLKGLLDALTGEVQ
jgi:hypothetical protein